MLRKSHSHGFTLLELMIALTLFSLIGVGAHAMLHSVLASREASQEHVLRLASVQKAIRIVTQDITQMESQNRQVSSPAYLISFIRRGWNNPLLQNRSDRIGVAYALEDQKLTRYYWPAESANAMPLKQILLDKVSEFSIRRLSVPAYEILLDAPPFGSLRRVIEVPSS